MTTSKPLLGACKGAGAAGAMPATPSVLTADESLALLEAWQHLRPDQRRDILNVIRSTGRLNQATTSPGEG